MVLTAGTTVVNGVMTTPNLQLLPGATLRGNPFAGGDAELERGHPDGDHDGKQQQRE